MCPARVLNSIALLDSCFFSAYRSPVLDAKPGSRYSSAIKRGPHENASVRNIGGFARIAVGRKLGSIDRLRADPQGSRGGEDFFGNARQPPAGEGQHRSERDHEI